MEKYAIVKFIGKEEDYVYGECKNKEWQYCKDCEKLSYCDETKKPYFIKDKEYKAYFLDYCQGERNVLDIEAENGEILSFVPLSDFKVILDKDNVLNDNYFVVKCIKANEQMSLTLNKNYKALKTDKENKYYYILDDSFDCYYYPKEFFSLV